MFRLVYLSFLLLIHDCTKRFHGVCFYFNLSLQQTKKEGTSKSKPTTHSTKDSPDTKLSPSDKKSESRHRIKSQESDIVINWKGSSTEPETDYGTTCTSFSLQKVK